MKNIFKLSIIIILTTAIIFSLWLFNIKSSNNTVADTTASTSQLRKHANTIPYKNKDQGVPVLMYHSVGFDKNNPLVITPEKLEEQFKYLKANNYYTITLDNLYSYFINGIQIPEKSVVLTFDDGYKNNYTELFPLLKKYNFTATIFMITSCIDNSANYLTSAELKEMSCYGIDIESHTVNHEHLKTLTKGAQLDTLIQSKTFLEKLLNKKINYIAYPYGEYNNDTLICAEQAGYKLALTTDGRWAMKKNGILSLDRVYISSFFSLDIFIDRITNPNYKFR